MKKMYLNIEEISMKNHVRWNTWRGMSAAYEKWKQFKKTKATKTN